VLSRVVTALVIATLLLAGSSRQAGSRPAAAASPPPYLVVIVMDGFRPDYETLAPMHHLRALMKRGRTYDTAWVGQIESETPTGHATIATGVYPRKHGVIGFGWRDPATGQFNYIPTNVPALKGGALSRVVEQDGVPTISDLIHARNHSALAVSVSGEKLWASAPMGVGADYVLYGTIVNGRRVRDRFQPFALGPNIPPARTGYKTVSEPDGAFDTQDAFAADVAVKLVKSLHPQALLLNLPATDIAGHYYGGMGDPRDMTHIIRSADSAIGTIVNLYRKLGLLNRTLFVVTADHGMVAGRHRVPIHQIYGAVRAAPVQQLDQDLQSSIGSIWLRDPEHAEALAASLAAKHFNGVEGALYRAQTPGGASTYVPEPWTAKHLPEPLLKAYLDLADTEASSSGADILLPYGEDTTGLQSGKAFHGMHGGFSWGAQHIPLILAGPGVRPGVSHFPAKLVDIAPTIERLIGLPVPAGVDGVVLADAVSGSSAPERAAQQAVQSSRLADVRVLQAHSAAQSHANP
jgi:predicted AlkP superfamily pyrophosphatase or phosphodiesterase